MRVQPSQDRGVLVLLRGYEASSRRLDDIALRLSTGLNLNRPGDNPTAQLAASQLRSQLTSVDSQIETTQKGIDLFSVANSALTEIENLIQEIRNSIVTAQGSSDIDEISNSQQEVDNALDSIDLLADTALYGRKQLLNGNSELKASSVPSALKDIKVFYANSGGAGSKQDFSFVLTAPGSRGTDLVGNAGDVAAMGGGVTVRVTGPDGTKDIDLLVGQTNTQFGNAVNASASSTGVAAVIGAAVNLFTQFEGSSQSFTVSQVGGAGTFVPGALTGTGTDLQGTVNGFTIQTDGNHIRAVGPNYSLRFEYDPGAGGASPFNFSVTGGTGLEFKFGLKGQESKYLGLPDVNSNLLGSFSRTIGTVQAGGFLSDLRTGGAASLLTDVDRSESVSDNALAYIQNLNSFVGGTSDLLFASQKNFLTELGKNLESARSRIEDLDFAKETALQTEFQIMRQVQVASIASIQINAQSVLDLLKSSDNL